ncbi:unnamed protein product, partial [Schistocephalus solidus]|uniref:Uncharacterized protein n=1 Tax=Schistocephalus solidus TaxID=70667 RepID=A0A183TS67_SCHSO
MNFFASVEGYENERGPAPAGNRTRAARVAGEHSTTEPPAHIPYCPASALYITDSFNHKTLRIGGKESSTIKRCHQGSSENPGVLVNVQIVGTNPSSDERNNGEIEDDDDDDDDDDAAAAAAAAADDDDDYDDEDDDDDDDDDDE